MLGVLADTGARRAGREKREKGRGRKEGRKEGREEGQGSILIPNRDTC